MKEVMYVKKWAVEVWESERGWGRSLLNTYLYDTQENAMEKHQEVNSKNTAPTAPDYYIYAEFPYEKFVEAGKDSE